MKTRLLVPLVVLVAGQVQGQSFADAGFMGGCGIGVLPTSAVAPKAQFRVSGARMATLATGGGLTIVAIGAGLSSHLEGYFRLVDDQSGTPTALTTLAFGGKLLLPFDIPVVTGAALWGEVITSDNPENLGLFPEHATRFGALLLPLQNGVRPSLLLGGIVRSDGLHPLLGAGVTMSVGHDIQLGGEIVEGYIGAGSRQGFLTGAVRVLPNIGIQAAGGYLKNREFSSWIVSVGVVAGSADLDFSPVPVAATPEFLIPDFDEIEKETNEEKTE